MKPLHILGICGSLRRKSFNRAALLAAQGLLPPDVTMEVADISSFPLYNDDVREQGYPVPVQQFRTQIADADAILISTPEYNYSVPGVLKNAIDWASRPPSQPFDGKALAIMSASPGAFGGARGQYHLRQVFIFMNAYIVNKPEVFISAAPSKFDEHGNLTDVKTQEAIRALLEALVKLGARLRSD